MNEEQIRALVDFTSSLAHIISNYHLELIKCGFTEDSALKLTINYQNTLIENAKSKTNE